MTEVSSYKDLHVWQKGIELADILYYVTESFPSDERFGLISQLRRAAVSVPSNIAEGSCRKNSTKDFIRFLHMAYSSLAEIDTQLVIAKNRRFISSDQYNAIYESIDIIMRMLNRFITSLHKRSAAASLNSQLTIHDT